jgi:hypothetical protein
VQPTAALTPVNFSDFSEVDDRASNWRGDRFVPLLSSATKSNPFLRDRDADRTTPDLLVRRSQSQL